MVASVGSSYNVLTLFQTGTDSPSAPKQEAVDAIIEKVRQLKAESSPAYVQATSFATDAWISGSEEEASSSVAEVTATDTTATVTQGATAEPKTIMISTVGMLISAVANYNDWLTSQDGVQASLDSYKSQLASATDAKSQERLTKIVNTIQSSIPKDAEHYQELGRQISEFQSKNGYDVAGTLAEQQDDGTFKIGVFVVSTEGKTYYEHDGSGTAREYNNAGVLRANYDLTTGIATDTDAGFW